MRVEAVVKYCNIIRLHSPHCDTPRSAQKTLIRCLKTKNILLGEEDNDQKVSYTYFIHTIYLCL